MLPSPTLKTGAASLVAVAAALLILALGGWQMLRARASVLADAEQNARTLCHALAQHAARALEAVDLVLSDVTDRVQSGADQARLAAYLERRVADLHQLRGIAVTDASGTSVADSYPQDGAVDLAGRSDFAWQRNHPGRELVIGDPAPDRFGSGTTIPVSRRIERPDGSFAGIAVAALMPDFFQAFYDSLNVGPRGTVTLYTAEGRILVRHPQVPEGHVRDISHASGAATVLAMPSGVSLSASPIDGRQRIFAFEHVRGYPLIVAAALSVEDALAGWRQDAVVEASVLVLAVAALLLLALILDRHRRRSAASEALARESEAAYRLLVQAVTNYAIFHLDPAGIVKSWNLGAQRGKGYEASEILGRHFSCFYTAEDRAAGLPERALETAVREGRFTTEGWRLRKDGRRFWADVVIEAIRDQDGAVLGFAKITRDDTERRKTEEALRDSQRRLQLITDNIPGLISNVDTELRYRFANRAYADWFRVDPAALIGTRLEDFYGPDAFADIADALHRTLTGAVVTGERDIEAAGGRRFCHVALIPQRDEADAVVGLYAIHTDITERRKAELALQASQDFLTRTGAVAGVGGWQVDLSDGSVTWSDQTCRLHDVEPGYRPTLAQATGYCTPESRRLLEAAIRTCVDHGEGWDLELECISATGRHFFARSTGTVESAGGAALRLVGALQDVTQLNLVQRQLRQKSANLEATLDSMEQGLLMVAADDTIELANRRLAELLDLPPDLLAAPQPKWRDLLAYLDRRGEFARADAAARRRIFEAPRTAGTFERARPNGRILEVRVAPMAGGAVVVTYADITARRQAEQALRQSEARYRLLADATSDVITQLDLDLVRRYVSPGCRAMLGYEPEEMTGARPAATIHPEDVAKVADLMVSLAAGTVPGDRATVTNRMRHKQGHWVWLEAGLTLVRDAEMGAPQSIICSLRDVTERRQAARALEEAKEAAEAAARIKAEFVANMSHELRTPLTGILGIHDLLREDPALRPEQRHYIDLAYDAGQSLLTIVNDVLDFSKIEAGQLSIDKIAFNLRILVEACRDFGREEAKKKALRIEARVEDGPLALTGDPNRLRQVLLNLLTNAVKFTETGSILITAGYRPTSGRLRVAVADTGIGIASDKLPLLFGRFSQADASITRRYGGTGLGLAICKRIVELMGGEIGVDSVPGRGSTFWFEVPLGLVRDVEAAPAAASPVAARPALRVLLAEDNMVNREIIAVMIEKAGHRVTAVDHGAAAVAAAQGGDFDVILLDLQMPIMDGLSAARAIRGGEAASPRPPTPIVGLTANAMADDVAHCREAGMNAHVAKPIEWPTLFATLEQCVGAARQVAPQAVMLAPILDDTKLIELSRFIGRERLAKMLDHFIVEVERRMTEVAVSSVTELAAATHSLMSLAGHFGFMELSRLCSEIEQETRGGTGLARLAELHAAAARAVDAARACAYGRAA